MYQSANNYILMYIHEHAVELSPCVPCVCTYLPTCYMYEYVYIYVFCHVYISIERWGAGVEYHFQEI